MRNAYLATPSAVFHTCLKLHSESKVIHEQALKLFSEPGLENQIDFEIRHKKMIDRFGRYPYRNAVLGRESTEEEIEFMKQPGSSF